jgi:CASP C terminal
LRAEIRSLQSDNLKLYEKVRYMQSYRENAHSTLDPLPASSTIAPSATELNKYSARYEEAMNPFEAFRGRVRLILLTLLFNGNRIEPVVFPIFYRKQRVLIRI